MSKKSVKPLAEVHGKAPAETPLTEEQKENGTKKLKKQAALGLGSQHAFSMLKPLTRHQLSKKALKKQKKGPLIAGTIALSLVFSLGAYLLANNIVSWITNSAPPKKDPFTSDKIFDFNGHDEDFEFDDQNQIVTDKMSEEEKAILLTTFGDLVLEDANSRSEDGTKIEGINKIISVSLLPCNMNQDNEFNKYILSILFEDDKGEIYALNYFTGEEFSSSAETKKDRVSDFINFLGKKCYLDSCSSMSQMWQEVKAGGQAPFDGTTIFVGEPYVGHPESSNLSQYFLPVYSEDGTGEVYYSLADSIDSYIGIDYDDPSDAFWEYFKKGELVKDGMPIDVLTTPFVMSEDLQKVMEILAELTAPDNADSQQNENSQQTEDAPQNEEKRTFPEIFLER